MKQQKIILVCLIIFSIVCAFWLTAGFMQSIPAAGVYHQPDPDALLFLRLFEQSVLRGEVMNADEYACFPHVMRYVLPPFYLAFLVKSTWLIYSIFPGLSSEPVVVAGFFPVIFFWLGNLMVFLTCWRLTRNTGFLLFLGVCLLPNISSAMIAGFLKLDYDFLISFAIWAFLLGSALFVEGGREIFKISGALAAAMLVATWSGSPLFFLLVTIYGLVCLFFDSRNVHLLLDYFSSAMLIAAMLNLLYVLQSPYSANGFKLTAYGYFQPACVLLGSLFLRSLPLSSIGRVTLARTIAVFAVLSGVLLLVGGDAIIESAGILSRKDPVLETINELRPMFSAERLPDNQTFKGLYDYFGWPVFLTPLICFLPHRFYGGRKMWHLRNWLILFLLMSVYQLRYVRWFGAALGLLYAMIFYALWRLIVDNLNKHSHAPIRAVLVMLPLLVLHSLNGFAINMNPPGLDRFQVDLFSWLGRNTPETSGYTDRGRPEYSVLCYWDEGNLLSYYTRRPVVVGNYLNGYQTMAAIFAADDPEKAADLCEQNLVRYIVVSARAAPSSKIFSFWKYLEKQPFSSEYRMVTEPVPPANGFEKSFYAGLKENFGLGSPGKSLSASRFRIVYASKADLYELPQYTVFEKIKGAELQLNCDPGTHGTISLEIEIGSKRLWFRKESIADEKGGIIFRLPYSTAYYGGRIKTAAFYRLAIKKAGVTRFFKVFVDGPALQGRSLNLQESLEEVTGAAVNSLRN